MDQRYRDWVDTANVWFFTERPSSRERGLFAFDIDGRFYPAPYIEEERGMLVSARTALFVMLDMDGREEHALLSKYSLYVVFPVPK
jgi:hypothetical protein